MNEVFINSNLYQKNQNYYYNITKQQIIQSYMKSNNSNTINLNSNNNNSFNSSMNKSVINSMINSINDSNNNSIYNLEYKYGYAAVHFRAGHLDDGRKVLTVETFMYEILQKIKLYEKQSNKQINIIYFASMENTKYFISENYMKQTYPSKYIYKFLNYLFDGNSEFDKLIYFNRNISRFSFNYEFFSDLELFVNSDVFIGSRSCIYIAVGALRYARYYQNSNIVNNTCLIDENSKFLCENMSNSDSNSPNNHEIKRIWRHYYAPVHFSNIVSFGY